MSALRAALIFILAGGATSALADQITCESLGERAEACGTVAAGSSVRLVRQLSGAPCAEGRNWGTGPNRDSIWVSGGCRAVFDVQPPYESTADDASDRSLQDRSPEWQRGFDDGQRGTFDGRVTSGDYRSGFEAGKDSALESDSDNEVQNGDETYHDARNPSEIARDDTQNSPDDDRDDAVRRDERSNESSRRYADADRLSANARRACIDEASADESFGPEDVTVRDVRRIGHGTFAVGLETPDGTLTCSVDRDGNVMSINDR